MVDINCHFFLNLYKKQHFWISSRYYNVRLTRKRNFLQIQDLYASFGIAYTNEGITAAVKIEFILLYGSDFRDTGRCLFLPCWGLKLYKSSRSCIGHSF